MAREVGKEEGEGQLALTNITGVVISVGSIGFFTSRRTQVVHGGQAGSV